MLRLGKGQEHEGFDGFRCYHSDMKSTTFALEMREKYLSFWEGTRAAVWEEVTQVRVIGRQHSKDLPSIRIGGEI